MTKQVRLSVVILTKNNEKTLSQTLKSVQWADEVLIIDSGSTDQTLTIAHQYNAIVHQKLEWQGFGFQRRWGQQQATGDYILMIDSDEVVTDELATSIQRICQQPIKQNTVYRCARRNRFLNRYMKSCGWYPDWVERLYLNGERQYQDQKVHESLDTTNAEIVSLNGDLLHETCDNYGDFQQKQMRYAKDWAQERHQAGKKTGLTSAFTHALSAFLKNYLFRRGILEGKHGLLLCLTIAQYTFNKYAMLWALNQAQDHD